MSGFETSNGPNNEPAEAPRASDPVGAAARDAARLEEPHEREGQLPPARRARDPCGGGEDEAANPLGPARREPQRHHPAERVPEDVRLLDPFGVEQPAEHVGEARKARRRQRRRAAVARQVGDQEPPPGQERGELLEVPRRPAEAVHEQERRPFPGREEPDTGSTPFVVLLFEAREKYRRIRHVDRLFCEDCELAGDKAGCPLIPCLCPKELKS